MYCQKGRRVYLEGRLRTREFTDSDGVRRWSTEVVGDMVKLLGGRAGRPDVSPVYRDSVQNLSRRAFQTALADRRLRARASRGHGRPSQRARDRQRTWAMSFFPRPARM